MSFELGFVAAFEIADVGALVPPVHALQRSLVARSLLMADKAPRNRAPAR